MENQSITAVFDDPAKAESAIGRLEVLGVLPENIVVDVADDEETRTTVTASVELRLVEKATMILSADSALDNEPEDKAVERARADTKDVA